jgi:hypothetical protein
MDPGEIPIAVQSRGVGCGERIVKRTPSELAILSRQGVVVYVLLQNDRRGEEDTNGETLQVSQRLKAPSIESLIAQSECISWLKGVAYRQFFSRIARCIKADGRVLDAGA